MYFQAMKREGGMLNAYYLVKDSDNMKRLHTVLIPTICHPGKDKTMKTVKR